MPGGVSGQINFCPLLIHPKAYQPEFITARITVRPVGCQNRLHDARAGIPFSFGKD